jgi:hypothetical protein
MSRFYCSFLFYDAVRFGIKLSLTIPQSSLTLHDVISRKIKTLQSPSHFDFNLHAYEGRLSGCIFMLYQLLQLLTYIAQWGRVQILIMHGKSN